MKSTFALLLLLGLLPCGCAPRLPAPAAEGERIVSLAPNLTEIICAIGKRGALVGRTSACDYPPEIIESVPVIGGFGAPSLERLLKTNPTLVVDAALEDESVVNLMAQLGIRRVRVPCRSLDDIPPAILMIGRLAQAEPAAHQLAEHIRRGVAERREALAKRRITGQNTPTVFVEIWSDPLMTVGRNSFVAELIALAGGKNLGDEVADKDYFPVSGEWVIARDPDIILCLYMTESGRRTTDDGRQTADDRGQQSEINNQKSEIRRRLAGRTGWAQIKAVRSGRVFGGFDNNLILRPGPRVLEGIKVIQECMD